MSDIIINNSNVVINTRSNLPPKQRHFKKMLKIGKLRFYVTWDFRLKNSQARDQERNHNNNIMGVKHKLWQQNDGHCQMCGKKMNKFSSSTVHHVLSWWRFPQFESDERNLMLLCRDCHNTIHKDCFLESRLVTAKAKELGVNLKDYYDV